MTEELILVKIYIRGFAEMQREVERTLSAHTGEVIEHMLKCYLMPDHPAVNHWKSEIANQICSVNKLKNTKKYPTANKIYAWTYEQNCAILTNYTKFSNFVREICNDYSIETIEPVKDIMDDFNKICKEYFSWLANMLSTSGKAASTDIYDKLDELFR
jgi:hypothetical protein